MGRIEIPTGEGTFLTLDITVLLAAVVVMSVVWWLYRKFRGRGYATILSSVAGIAGGIGWLHMTLPEILGGRTRCFGSGSMHRLRMPWICDERFFWRDADPAAYWLNAGLWVACAVFLIGGGTYVLHRVVSSKRHSADDVGTPQGRRRAAVLWSVAAVCVAGLSVWLLIASRGSEPLYAPPREALQLRLDHDAK